MSECANCGSEMDMERAVWWTPEGICCKEQCAREITVEYDPEFAAAAQRAAKFDPELMMRNLHQPGEPSPT